MMKNLSYARSLLEAHDMLQKKEKELFDFNIPGFNI